MIFASKILPEFEVHDMWSRQRTLPNRNATTLSFKVKWYYKPTHKKKCYQHWYFKRNSRAKCQSLWKFMASDTCPGIPISNQGIVVRLLAGAIYFPFPRQQPTFNSMANGPISPAVKWPIGRATTYLNSGTPKSAQFYKLFFLLLLNVSMLPSKGSLQQIFITTALQVFSSGIICNML
jgi:hypothetical protein